MTNHEKIRNAFQNLRNRTFKTEEIIDMVMRMYPNFAKGSILPNDHAEGNKSPCRCAGTEERIFDRIERGKYTVR